MWFDESEREDVKELLDVQPGGLTFEELRQFFTNWHAEVVGKNNNEKEQLNALQQLNAAQL